MLHSPTEFAAYTDLLYELVGWVVVEEIIDVPVGVVFASAGGPVAYFWDRFEHTVIGRQDPVFTRRPWWETAVISTVIDAGLWRLDAARDPAEQHRYDLGRDADGSWVLAVDWG